MRHIKIGALVCVLGLAAAGAAGGAAASVEQSFADASRWSIGRIPSVRHNSSMRCRPRRNGAPRNPDARSSRMVLSDVHRDLDVDATIARLQLLAIKAINRRRPQSTMFVPTRSISATNIRPPTPN